MARTKAEIRAFLNAQVGQSVNAKAGIYKGQCVSLTKALLEFLGAPDPYAARGDAKDAGDTYIRQGIGTVGRGWLTVVVNRDMGVIGGVRYGHIWIDLMNEANYEQNGNRALITTKNTRPISQGQQFINLDKWVKGDSIVTKIKNASNWRWRFNRLHHQLVRNADMSDRVFQGIVGQDPWKVVESWSDHAEANRLIEWQVVGEKATKDDWAGQIKRLQEQVKSLGSRPTQSDLDKVKAEAAKLSSELNVAKAEAVEARRQFEESEADRQATVEEANGFVAAVVNVIRSFFKK